MLYQRTALLLVYHIVQTLICVYRGADKSLARPGRKQARKHVRNARDFNNIETRAVIKFFFFLQGKAPKETHVILTETLTRFLPVRAKDLSAPLHFFFGSRDISFGIVTRLGQDDPEIVFRFPAEAADKSRRPSLSIPLRHIEGVEVWLH